jgi:hypothetical protein
MSALPPVHESLLPKEHVLHRPRHGRRQRLALVCAVVFFTLPVISLAAGLRPTAFENHRLAAFPALSRGWSFYTGLGPWATDHLPFRQQAINAGNSVSRGLFGELPAYGGSGNQVAPQPAGPLPAAANPPPAPSEFPSVLAGKDNWMYLGAELSSHCDQTQATSDIVTELRRLHDGVVASGRQFVVVIAPDKATMVPQYLPDDFPGKACHANGVDQFWRAMATQNYVIDLRGDLTTRAKQLGTPIYGPQDAHWSDEGAVIMAERLADQLQPGISDRWTVRPGAAWQVPADLPPLISQTGTTFGRYYSILPDGQHDMTPQTVDTNYNSTSVHFDTAVGLGTIDANVGVLADSFSIRASRYLASVFGHLTLLGVPQVDTDHGVAAGQMLANNSVVVVEVAERNLVGGQYALLDPPVENTILTILAGHPIH